LALASVYVAAQPTGPALGTWAGRLPLGFLVRVRKQLHGHRHGGQACVPLRLGGGHYQIAHIGHDGRLALVEELRHVTQLGVQPQAGAVEEVGRDGDGVRRIEADRRASGFVIRIFRCRNRDDRVGVVVATLQVQTDQELGVLGGLGRQAAHGGQAAQSDRGLRQARRQHLEEGAPLHEVKV